MRKPTCGRDHDGIMSFCVVSAAVLSVACSLNGYTCMAALQHASLFPAFSLASREALVALQAAAVLRLDPGLPAGSNAGRPAAPCWELLPAAAGLDIDEATVDAAAAHVAAAGAQAAGSGGSAAARSKGQAAAPAAAGTGGGQPSARCSSLAAADAPPPEAGLEAAAALPLPPALAAQWLQAASPPSDAALQLLRPAAAAVLQALRVSCCAHACLPCRLHAAASDTLKIPLCPLHSTGSSRQAAGRRAADCGCSGVCLGGGAALQHQGARLVSCNSIWFPGCR